MNRSVCGKRHRAETDTADATADPVSTLRTLCDMLNVQLDPNILTPTKVSIRTLPKRVVPYENWDTDVPRWDPNDVYTLVTNYTELRWLAFFLVSATPLDHDVAIRKCLLPAEVAFTTLVDANLRQLMTITTFSDKEVEIICLMILDGMRRIYFTSMKSLYLIFKDLRDAQKISYTDWPQIERCAIRTLNAVEMLMVSADDLSKTKPNVATFCALWTYMLIRLNPLASRLSSYTCKPMAGSITRSITQLSISRAPRFVPCENWAPPMEIRLLDMEQQLLEARPEWQWLTETLKAPTPMREWRAHQNHLCFSPLHSCLYVGMRLQTTLLRRQGKPSIQRLLSAWNEPEHVKVVILKLFFLSTIEQHVEHFERMLHTMDHLQKQRLIRYKNWPMTQESVSTQLAQLLPAKQRLCQIMVDIHTTNAMVTKVIVREVFRIWDHVLMFLDSVALALGTFVGEPPVADLEEACATFALSNAPSPSPPLSLAPTV